MQQILFVVVQGKMTTLPSSSPKPGGADKAALRRAPRDSFSRSSRSSGRGGSEPRPGLPLAAAPAEPRPNRKARTAAGLHGAGCPGPTPPQSTTRTGGEASPRTGRLRAPRGQRPIRPPAEQPPPPPLH